MKKLVVIFIVLSAVLFAVQAQQEGQVEAAESTILISMEDTDENSYGSGFMLEENRVVTAYHVVDRGDPEVVFTNDEAREAEVVGRNSSMDLALLEVETPEDMTAISISEEEPSSGDRVAVAGYPFGIGLTLEHGRVTGIGENLYVPENDLNLSEVIETDARTFPGDSGGPLLDSEGDVVGVIVAASADSGYAVNAEQLNSFLQQSEQVPEQTVS